MDAKLKRKLKIALVLPPLFIWEAYFFLLTKLYEGSRYIDSKIDTPLNIFLRK